MSTKFSKPKRDSRLRRASRPEKLTTMVRQEVIRQVRRGAETKVFDGFTGSTVSSAGSLNTMSVIPLGTSANTRIGNEVDNVSGEITFQSTVGLGDKYNLLRYIVFQWHNDNASLAPVVSSILDVDLATPYACLNPYAWSGRKEYTILVDVKHIVDETAEQICVSKHKYKAKPLTFSTGLTTGVNMIYLLVISDSNIVPNPAYAYVNRLYFKDG